MIAVAIFALSFAVCCYEGVCKPYYLLIITNSLFSLFAAIISHWAGGRVEQNAANRIQLVHMQQQRQVIISCHSFIAAW